MSRRPLRFRPLIDCIDLDLYNGLTKYPSIPTYHARGERGKLLDEVQVDFSDVSPRDLVVTHKYDGTNVRVIVDNTSYGTIHVIGSRDRLLWATGDRLYRDEMGIVDTVLYSLGAFKPRYYGGLTVYFLELVGKGINGCRLYDDEKLTGLRLFDIMVGSRDALQVTASYSSSDAALTWWREAGEQRFLHEDYLETLQGPSAYPPLVARWAPVKRCPESELLAPPPLSIKETFSWMDQLIGFHKEPTEEELLNAGHTPEEVAAAVAENARAQARRTELRAGVDLSWRPEGLILRTRDRSKIAKFRFADYLSTMMRS